MKLLFVILFCLNVFCVVGQGMEGKWITYSLYAPHWEKERISEDKKDKTVLVLKKDSTYVKKYWAFNTTTKDSCRHLYFRKNLLDDKFVDSNGRLLRQRKHIERGTYSINKNKQEILFQGHLHACHYTLENNYLILKLSTEGLTKTGYMFEKFKLK